MRKINKTPIETRLAIERRSAAMLPDRPTQAGFKPWDIRNALFSAIIADKGACLMGEIDRIVDETNAAIDAAIDALRIKSGTLTVPMSRWKEEETPRAECVMGSIYTAGCAVLFMPEDDETKEQAGLARLSMAINETVDGEWSDVVVFVGEGGDIPSVDLHFRYVVMPTESEAEAVVALIGVDAYDEGGVDENAVKKIITAMLGNVANERQYSAAYPPPYPVTSVNGKVGAVNLTIPSEAADVKADPTGTAQTLVDDLARKTAQDLANYYTKSQTLNKDEINALVSAIPKFKIEVVTSLPASNISETTVYLVKSGEESNNLYTEYIYSNGEWERLGAQTVDLSGYSTTEQMNAAISEATKDLAPKSSIPTKVSQLTNDSGYISQHQSLDHLLPIQQGASNAGKILVVGADGRLTLTDMPTGGAEIEGRIDEIDGKPVIVLEGNVPVGTYTAFFVMEDGELVEGGVLTLSDETPLATYTVTFVADGVTVAVVEYTEGDTTLSNIPEVPTKDGYTGAWETFDITNGGNITVNAIYTEIPANTYTVTKNPTYCTINGGDTVTEGEAYTATVTANEGYELSSVTVTMGGTDITGTTYDGAGNISIASVTGNIVITATATKGITNWLPISTDESGNKVGWIEGYRLSTSSGTASQKTGVNATGFIPVQYNDTVLISNAAGITGGTDPHICFYNSDKEKLVNGVQLSTIFTETADVFEGVLNSYTLSALTSDLKYIRISSSLLTADTIINIKRNGEWL